MKIHANSNQPVLAGEAGFTLIEVAFAAAIAAMLVAGMFQGYNVAAQQAQFSACNLAANTTAMKQLEQITAADWIPSYDVTQLFSTTLTAPQTGNLCLPISGGNVINCTNYATITQVSTSPPYAMIQVQCVWSFPTTGRTYTNTVAVIRAPNI